MFESEYGGSEMHSLYFTLVLFFALLPVKKHYVCCKFLEVNIQIPDNVKSGSTATLCCFFNYDINEIYSVKWYRGNREFYRYMPSQDPAIKIFPLPVGGLDIDKKKSNATHVTLQNISDRLAGQFSCEVTAGEKLTTITQSEHLYIYDPSVFKTPSISLSEDKSVVICSTIKANLSKKFSTCFYVDNEKIDQKYLNYDDYDSKLMLHTNLLDWNDAKSKVIHCEVDLPGVSPISSEEIVINNGVGRMMSSKFLWTSIFSLIYNHYCTKFVI